jgi:hypothetical protein
MRTKLLIIAVLLVLLAGLGYVNRGWVRDALENLNKTDLPESVNRSDVVAQTNGNTNAATNTSNENVNAIPEPKPLPVEFNLSVPFTTQAPLVNWDHAHDEACEEAALMIVDAYWNDLSLSDKAAVDRTLLDIEAWETERFGYYESTTVEETVIMAREYFHMTNVSVVEDPTVEQLKRLIADGKPVLVPAAGRELGNPNFRSPGPLYHFLVLKGYTADTFITNDPGTRKGADYVYDIDVIMNAMHDWNGGDVLNGEKAVIVVEG